MASGNRDHKWSETVTALAGNFSAWVLIPGWVKNLTATALPGGGGTALIQHTTAPRETVESSPGSITPVAWEPGSVAVPTTRAAMGPVTAVRIQAVTANATMELTGDHFR